MNLTETVMAAMESKGMNRACLARATGYSYQHIHDLIAGERRWNEDSMTKVCAVLGISISFEFQTSNHQPQRSTGADDGSIG